MELKACTSPGPDFKRYFARLRDTKPELSRCGEMMLALVEHLENEVEGPPRWANTSSPGELILFAERKYTVVVRINAYPRAMSQIATYEIRYVLQPPWDCVRGYTSDVHEAGAMILYALEHAYTGERDQTSSPEYTRRQSRRSDLSSR